MAHITITLCDAPNLGVHVATDADRPTVGRGLTPAESLALDLLANAARSQATVLYDASSIPLVALALELISPDGDGWSLPPEMRQRIKRALGPRMGQLVPQPSAVGGGLDINRIHAIRGRASL